MNRTQIKARHKELGQSEPFTAKESQQFNKKDQSMIRNIQILNNMDKKSAIKLIKQYKTTPKKALKQMAKDYRKILEKGYPTTTPEIRGEIPQHGKKQSKRTGDTLRHNRQSTQKYLKTPKNRNQASYKRIEKASKKYIDASPYELRNGVNSPKSQNYRERIGLSRQYEGRVIK